MQIIDLSQPICNGMPVYTGDCPTMCSQAARLEKDGYNLTELTMSVHSGTHIDAPAHFFNHSRVDELALDKFFLPCTVLDVRGISLIDVPIPCQGGALLLYAGFDAHYQTPAYLTEHPEVSDSFCMRLIEAGVSILGTDFPSMDYPPHPRHKQLLQAQILLLENLCGLGQLPSNGFYLSCLPLRLCAEGSPVRAAAVFL